jgi:hypothetical protein
VQGTPERAGSLGGDEKLQLAHFCGTRWERPIEVEGDRLGESFGQLVEVVTGREAAREVDNLGPIVIRLAMYSGGVLHRCSRHASK